MSRGGLAALALLMGMAAFAPTAAAEPGPTLSEPVAKLDEALTCSPGVSGSHVDPVLLVPAFSTADESYGWNYLPDLPQRGIPTCSVTLEDHGFDDLQRAAEYAVHAIRSISARSGRKVAVLGHQHGALDLLWALRWWPDIAARVSDYISLATPHRGTTSSGSICSSAASCPPSAWQIAVGSSFPGGAHARARAGRPAYTSIATAYDVLITPAPQASEMEGARNIVLQDICPGRPVDHFGILGDSLTHKLVLDALTNPGPAEPARLADPCGGPSMFGTIEDEAFLSRVERGEAFRKGDFLECRMRVEQFREGESLRSEYYVTQVIRHIERAEQEPLGELPPGE